MAVIRKTVFFWIILLIFTGQALGSGRDGRAGLDPQTYDIVMKIKEREGTLKTFSARFDQIQKSSLFEEVVKSTGIILYDATGKLMFRVSSPDPLVILFDGEWVTVYDPELKKTRKRKIGQRENLLKKYFGVGQPLEELTRRFDIKAKSNAPLAGVTLEMRPIKGGMARHVQMVSAVVDNTTWLPQEILIQQNKQDWSRLFLTFTSVNKPLAANLFSLDGTGDATPDGGKEMP